MSETNPAAPVLPTPEPVARPGSKRSFGWINYALITIGALYVVTQAQPSAIVVVAVAGAYSTYLFLGGSFVRQIWMPMITRANRRGSSRAVAALVAVAASCGLAGCADTSPTTRTQMCSSFSELGVKALGGNGFGNPVFKAIGDTASIAQRYPGDAGVVSDGKQLDAIAGSKATNGNALRNASMHIANLCGHPLGLGG